MQDFVSGAFKGNRLSAVKSVGNWNFAYGDGQLTSGSDYKLCTIPVPAGGKVALKLRTVVEVASDAATTDVLRVGTAAGGTQYLNDVNLKSAAGTNLTTTNDTIILTADTDIYIRQTVTGAKTVGKFSIFVEPWEMNPTAYNTLEA